jgi:hypothetical protein
MTSAKHVRARVLAWAVFLVSNAAFGFENAQAQVIRPRAFPAFIAPAADPAKGAHLQHSLRLLAGIKCQGDRPVKVLFYGQSISAQLWSKRLATFLRETYPQTEIEVENRAIGGHVASLLVKTAEADLYPFQPDLVIFHVYGSLQPYETIIKNIRQRTTADVLIASDHIVSDDELDEEVSPLRLGIWRRTSWAKDFWSGVPFKTWTAWHNAVFLPEMVGTYGVELVDVRRFWKSYLKANQLKASQLLRDEVHLNAHGEFLMLEIVKTALHPSLLTQKTCDSDRSRELLVGKDFQVKSGRISLPFDGTRAEVVLSVKPPTNIVVMVDKRKPQDIAEGFAFTRTTAYPTSNWPTLLQVRTGPVLPFPEAWTITLRSISVDHATVEFDIVGSVTGPDGVGTSTKRFVSNSGRVVIEPSDWNLARAKLVWGQSLPLGFQIRWSAVPAGTNTLDFATRRSGAASEGLMVANAVTGLPNEKHLLELQGDGVSNVHAIRVFKPPLR